MKYTLAIFLLCSFHTNAQNGQMLIGISKCRCATDSLENTATYIRSFHTNGKIAQETLIKLSSTCQVGDTAITTYDSLGRIRRFQKGEYAWERSYDSTGLLLNETTFLPDHTIHRSFEYRTKGDKLKSIIPYSDGVPGSITHIRGRKEKTKHENRNVDRVKYNKDKQALKYIHKFRNPEGKRIVIKAKNRFNSEGDPVRSVRTENGKTVEIVHTFYENNELLKTEHHQPTSNTRITTYYHLE